MTVTHEAHSTETSTPLADNERRMLDVAQVEAWRDHQRQVLTEHRSRADNGTDYLAEFTADNEASLDDFLRSQGMTNNDPHYDEIHTLYLGAGIDRIDDEQWYASAESRGEHGSTIASGRDEFAQTANVRLGQEPSGETDTDQPDSVEVLDADLDLLRTKMAEANAKRGSKLFGKRSKEYAAIEAEYNAAIQQRGRQDLAATLSGPGDDSSKNAAVVAYLFEEQQKLRDETTANLNGTPLGRWVTMMNKGSKWQRAGKAVALGAAFGFGGALIAGAIGTGIAAGAAVAAGRFVRGYVAHDDRGVRTLDEREIHADTLAAVMAEEQTALDSASMEREDRFASAQRHLDYLYEDEAHDQQTKRRKAFAWGAGSVAVGSVLGYGLHYGLSQTSQIINNKYDFQLLHPLGYHSLNPSSESINDGFVSDFDTPDIDVDLDGDGTPDINDPAPANPNVGGDADVDADPVPYGDRDPDGDGYVNRDDPAPHNPDIPADRDDVTLPGSDERIDLDGDSGENAREVTIEAGHGYTHELIDFAEANGQSLTPAQAFELHTALLEEFGDDYIDIDGVDLDTYHESNDVRLSMPGTGLWHDGAPQFTARWMQQHGLWTESANA